MKQQFLLATADTFKASIYENNRRITVASAALTVYRPGGDTKLLDGAAMTAGGDGVLSFALTAEHNDTAGINYRAVIEYVHGSKTSYATVFYDIVRSRLAKVITDEDIINELPQLKDNGWTVRGAAESGSVTTIVDAGLKRYEDDYFTGGLAYSVLKGETREITGFVSSTGTVTATAFSSAISAGEAYTLSRSFSREIHRAFEKLEERLSRLGRRPHLILDPYDLREAHILYSVAEACKGLAAESGGFWWTMWKEYEKMADGSFEGIRFKYDSSGDGNISLYENSAANCPVKAARR